MIRYRPPSPQSSPYITAPGHAALREELDALWTRRRDVVIHVTAAAAEGDRSENAEYIYRKKQLREIDRRIRYLQKRLPVLQVVEATPAQAQRVFFSAHVRLCDESENEVCYRLVGADEIDAKKNWISIDSPMAKALVGRALNDEVQVRTPAGTMSYQIVGIEYT